MKQTSRILTGLAAGLVIGLSVSPSESPALVKIFAAIETAGAVWVSLFKMTVYPPGE